MRPINERIHFVQNLHNLNEKQSLRRVRDPSTTGKKPHVKNQGLPQVKKPLGLSRVGFGVLRAFTTVLVKFCFQGLGFHVRFRF